MCGEPTFTEVVFHGGAVDGARVSLKDTPQRLHVQGPRVGRLGYDVYERIDDPDTGEFLGGYLFVEAVGDL